MALIEVNRNPSERELRWFGAGLLVFFALLGAIVYWRTGHTRVPAYMTGIGTALAILYYAVPRMRRPLYLAWMYAAFPIGWLISHVMLAAVFYLVVTPIGVGMRLLGRDPLRRRFDPGARTYWIPHNPAEDMKRYFRQF